MINSSLKEKYWDSATDKQMVISVVGTNQKIDNSMLEIGTFSLDESLCSESELKFGSCEANCVKFTARNMAGSIKGQTISISETVDGDTTNTMPYGVFKVVSDVPTADRTKRQITAYDAMYDIINADVKSWYAGLSFPMTLKAFRDSFFAYLGIEQAVATLPNDSMTVNKTLVATQTDDSSAVTEESAISGKTVVTAICEINGCFGNINRNGKFEYVILKNIVSALYPAEDLFPADNVFPSDSNSESMTGHYITFDYEDFQSKAITQLEIKTSEDNAGAIVGTAGNNYSITGNFLVSDKTGAELEQIANNLLPIMKQAAYTPIKSCTCVGNPCLTLGEPIRFNTTREIVETYLLQRTLTGVQSKRDSISAQGTQTHSVKVNSIRDTIESVERRTGKLERNADHLQSTYEDLEEQTSSKFEQTAESITAEVKRATDAEGELGASLELKVGRDENDQVVSMINASADQIVLRGNRLIVECNNFELDALGRVHIVDSLLYDSDNGTVEILTHDGQFRPLLQNVRLDTGSVLTPDGASLATEYDINAINSSLVDYAKKTDLPSLVDYAKKTDLPQGYITSASYSWSDRSTTKYAPRHFNTERDFGASSATLDIEGLLISLSGSDKRLKENIHPLRDIKGVYMAMCPVEYTWKDGYITQHKGLQFGLIAQDLEKILDDAGLSDSGLVLKENAEEDEKAIHGDSKTYKIDKEILHAMHIQMVQSQQKEIELLQQKNEDLERRLSVLERSVSHAENI
jgi:chaperonin cofactor prefoldin